MPQPKINFPTTTQYTCTIPIRITDLNYGNHVGNDAVVSLLHEARVQYLHHLHYSELNVQGVGLILVDLAVQYKLQMHYGNLITIHIAVQDITSRGFTLYYKLCNEQAALTALATTTMLCYDYATQKVAHLPTATIHKLTQV